MAFHFSSKIVTDGLAFYVDAANQKSYPGTGTSWRDLSLGGNNGTLINGPTFDSANGGSIVFDGVDDYTSFGTTLGNGWSGITVSVWINPSQLTQSNGQRYFIVNANDTSSTGLESVFNLFLGYFSNPTYYSNDFNGQYIIFGVRSSTQSYRNRPISIPDNPVATQFIQGCAFGQDTASVDISKWVHATGTYDGSETKIYINGIFKGTSNNQPDGVNRSVSGVLNNSLQTRFISHDVSTVNYNGRIANTQIYNRALSATEITQNYNAQKGRFGL